MDLKNMEGDTEPIGIYRRDMENLRKDRTKKSVPKKDHIDTVLALCANIEFLRSELAKYTGY